MIIVVMGVAGSGKTTVGALLALELGWDFYDGDDFHSDANRAKMSQRIPLNDEDRSTWLAALRNLINQNLSENRSIVLACSALKESYRHMLKVNEQVHFVHLQGSYQQIEERLRGRTGHFMSAEMLASQFDILEMPEDALSINISNTPQEIVAIICKGLNP